MQVTIEKNVDIQKNYDNIISVYANMNKKLLTKQLNYDFILESNNSNLIFNILEMPNIKKEINSIKENIENISLTIKNYENKFTDIYKKIQSIEGDIKWISRIIFYVLIPFIIPIIGIYINYFLNASVANKSISALNTVYHKNILEPINNASNYSLEKIIKKGNPEIISRIYLVIHDFSEKHNLYNDNRPSESENAGYHDLYNITGLPEFKNAGYTHWSPDSHRMVFISVKNIDNKIDEGGDIYIYNISENSLTHLKKAGHENVHPNFSPDGKMIVFSTYREDKERWDIATITADNKNLKILTSEEVDGEFDVNYYPTFSPDGNHILFCGKDTGTEPQVFYLFLMDKDGKNRKLICELGGVCHASYSPNYEFVVFLTIRSNAYHDIWIAPIVNGKCVTNSCPIIDEIKLKIPGLMKEKEYGYYYKKLTDIGADLKKANGHSDPRWLNNEEIIYLFANEYIRGVKAIDQNVNWTIKKINIYTGQVCDFPVEKANYRNPQPRK